jgi:hypothetical protein
MVLFATSLICLALCLALAVLLTRMGRASRVGAPGDCLARISATRYRPMQRLLDPAEEAFVAQHADKAAVRRFRAQRRRVFRGYLCSLERDFDKTCGAIRLVLVDSHQDRPELAAALMKQQARFVLATALVRGRLWLHAAGIGTVDARGLVGSLEAMCSELGQLVPAAAPSAA